MATPFVCKGRGQYAEFVLLCGRSQGPIVRRVFYNVLLLLCNSCFIRCEL